VHKDSGHVISSEYVHKDIGHIHVSRYVPNTFTVTANEFVSGMGVHPRRTSTTL
jgi:hypothetical protein